MAGKPKFRVIPNGTEENFPQYEIVMPDGNRFKYSYGKMQKINPQPLTRMREIDKDHCRFAFKGYMQKVIDQFTEVQ